MERFIYYYYYHNCFSLLPSEYNTMCTVKRIYRKITEKDICQQKKQVYCQLVFQNIKVPLLGFLSSSIQQQSQARTPGSNAILVTLLDFLILVYSSRARPGLQAVRQYWYLFLDFLILVYSSRARPGHQAVRQYW